MQVDIDIDCKDTLCEKIILCMQPSMIYDIYMRRERNGTSSAMITALLILPDARRYR